MKENGPNSGKRPPAGADNVTIDRNSEEAVFIGERTQKVVKLRRSLRSPEENIEVPPISARPEYCGASESGVLSVKFIEVKGRRIKKKPLLCNRAGKH